jgi:hypothetical protein
MTNKKLNSSYCRLLWDIIRAGSIERGVRNHDLLLQSLRDRPTTKPGVWGYHPDGSPMTRGEYEKELASLMASAPDFLYPEPDTSFSLFDTTGEPTSLSDLIDKKEAGLLTFETHLPSQFSRNNIVRAHLFPGGGEKAVVILTNLRAEEKAFATLGKLFARFGYTALEVVFPYHGERHDPEDRGMVPGERLFSANMHETLMSFSQCVSDILGCLLFLIRSGFTRIGGIGTSIGSTFLVLSLANARGYRRFLHGKDPSLVGSIPEGIFRAAVFNLSGGMLRDFITDPDNIEATFVRKGLVEDLGLSGEEIEELWPVVDPMKFAQEIDIPILSVKSRYDPVLLYRYAKNQREFFKENSVGGKNFREFYIPFPSGHYSVSYFLPKMTLGLCDLLFTVRHV